MNFKKPFFYTLVLFFSCNIDKSLGNIKHYQYIEKLYKENKKKNAKYLQKKNREDNITKDKIIKAGRIFLENCHDYIEGKKPLHLPEHHANYNLMNQFNNFVISINILKKNENFEIFLNFVGKCPELIQSLHLEKFKTEIGHAHYMPKLPLPQTTQTTIYRKNFNQKEYCVEFYKALPKKIKQYWFDILYYINAAEDPRGTKEDLVYKNKISIRHYFQNYENLIGYDFFYDPHKAIAEEKKIPEYDNGPISEIPHHVRGITLRNLDIHKSLVKSKEKYSYILSRGLKINNQKKKGEFKVYYAHNTNKSIRNNRNNTGRNIQRDVPRRGQNGISCLSPAPQEERNFFSPQSIRDIQNVRCFSPQHIEQRIENKNTLSPETNKANILQKKTIKRNGNEMIKISDLIYKKEPKDLPGLVKKYSSNSIDSGSSLSESFLTSFLPNIQNGMEIDKKNDKKKNIQKRREGYFSPQPHSHEIKYQDVQDNRYVPNTLQRMSNITRNEPFSWDFSPREKEKNRVYSPNTLQRMSNVARNGSFLSDFSLRAKEENRVYSPNTLQRMSNVALDGSFSSNRNFRTRRLKNNPLKNTLYKFSI